MTKAARKTKKPERCRYCGHVASDHVREEGMTRAAYSCRDAGACGARIRAVKPVSNDGLPF